MKHTHTLRLIFALSFFLFCGYYANSQTVTTNQNDSKQRKCATMEHLAWLEQQDPSLAAKMASEEQKFDEYIAAHQTELENSKATYTLPVVVHVVYNGTTGYVAPGTVQEQIDQTNSDWAGTNGRNMEAFNTSLRADAGITLCLATKDPSGNPSTGIDYKTTTVTSFSTNNGVKSTSTGGAAAWDPTKYLNIWVCNLPGYCGYAQFPTSGINSTYGVVIHYQYFGLTGASAPYNLGGTVSHEFGHCFNLYHTWGDEDACTGTDYCADVPNQAAATYGDNSGVLTDACSTSSPGIMYMNFMDYSDDIDYTNMTPNQVTRMQSAVSTYLTGVANNAATVCAAAAAPVADFSANPTTSCTGIIQFTDLSTNTPTSWAWTFGDGGTSTSQNPSHTYTTSGTYNVTLTATNGTGSDSETKTGYITITLPAAPTTTGATICTGETANISASGNNTLNWYDAASGGNLVNTGTTYTTPALTTTTTYYVESTTASASQYVGPADNTIGTGGYVTGTANYLIFDCYSPVTIVSADIYFSGDGARTFELRNSSGTVLQSKTVTLTGTTIPQTVTLDFSVPVGTNLQLGATGTLVMMYRNNAGTSFPYTAPGLLSITGASTASYYYYYYNMQLQVPGCTSARTPVVVTVSGATPSVAISAIPSGSICSGDNVTFTATPTNGGTSPTYQWQNNGTDISGATNSTYSSTALANGDVITCDMISNSSCATGSPVTSNSITMIVSTPLAASVSIAASPSATICAGASVTFTATQTNGGTTPAYQWQLNSSNISGATNSTYSSSALSNGDAVTCIMTSNLGCVSGSPATSNIITMSLPTAPTTTNDTLCSSGTATLGASGNPTLNWYDAATGGTLVNTGTSYTTPTITSTTSYYVESNTTSYGASQYVPCPAIGSASSSNTNRYHIFTVTVPVRLVSVQVQANSAGNRTIEFRNSSGVVLMDTIINLASGLNTIYLNWDMVAGTAYQLGLNATSTVALFRNSSGVTYPYQIAGLVSITGNSSAASYGFFYNWEVQPLTSCSSTRTQVTAVVGSGPAASVSIAANPSGAICTGTSVTFTATATNGGTTPTYQWKKNGTNISGATNSTYTSTALANGDIITCEMTSNEACVSGSPATSNGITMTVNAGGAASVSIAQSPIGSICAGTSVTFTATPTNGGTPSYQWKKNGTNISGATNSTYTSTVLANGDAITCQMTSSLSCATGSPATSNSITMTVYPSVPVSVTITANPSGGVCTGTSVTFTATPTNGGATPTYQWKKNGTNISGATTTTYTSAALANGDVITCVLTSTVTCASGNPATSNSITMSISSAQAASVSIAASPSGAICSGTSVTFTATPTNGGTATYQWKKNGTNISGATNSTYTSTALANGDIITCVMTSSLSCATGSPATSNSITMTVNAAVAASVSIAASPSGAICSGTSVTFTATATNGGTPTYQWKKNGTNISGATNSTYTSTALAQGDVISCVITSSLACATGSPATSNSITMTVSAASTASVSIAASPSGSICSGTSVTFTATAVNGGTPAYMWQVNGSIISGATNSTYTSTAFANGDNVTCIMTSSLSCATGSPALSNTVTMIVGTSGTASVAIAALPSNAICSGESVTFTATPTSGGTSPTYQWQLNGADISGATTTSYSSTSMADADVITCIMTSSDACVAGSPATSNSITMSVSTAATASVTISASPSTTICAGDNVTVTATAVNGGAPTYQWQLNGNNVGPNSSTVSATAFSDGDVLTCIMTSSLSCASGSPATSNSLTFTVTSSATVGVAIYASPSGSICTGTNVTFTASASNAGTSPTFQWQVNGIGVGSNSASYSSSTLSDADVVTCILTSASSCALNNPATSNAITMSVSSSLPAAISIAAITPTSICEGGFVTFEATPTNEGSSPIYQWQVNSSNVGTNSTTYTSSSFNDGDIISCIMTSSLSCATGNPATSNTIAVTIYPVPAAPIISQSGDTLYSDYPTGNQWYYSNMLGDFPITGATDYYYVPVTTGDYFTIAVDENGCVSDTSNAISVVVGIEETESPFIDLYPNPNNGVFDINYQSATGDMAYIEIINSIGQTLYGRNIPGNTMTRVNASFLAQGMYFLKVQTAESTYLYKILISK
jgi:PKD repeat protein